MEPTAAFLTASCGLRRAAAPEVANLNLQALSVLRSVSQLDDQIGIHAVLECMQNETLTCAVDRRERPFADEVDGPCFNRRRNAP